VTVEPDDVPEVDVTASVNVHALSTHVPDVSSASSVPSHLLEDLVSEGSDDN